MVWNICPRQSKQHLLAEKESQLQQSLNSYCEFLKKMLNATDFNRFQQPESHVPMGGSVGPTI